MASKGLIQATYLLAGATSFDPVKRAQAIAYGQTTDTWTPVSREGREKLERHRGVVLSTEAPEQSAGAYRCQVTVGFPPDNVEGDIPSLLTMLFGKVSLDGRIKLLDVKLPPEMLAQTPGPKFGVAGMRRATRVIGRPLAMAIFKPCVGLTAEELGDMFYKTALGGADLIKDDEILPDIAIAPAENRLEACLAASDRASRETGQKTLYAINLTGRLDSLHAKARRLASQGANCFLLNVLSYGYGALEMLARDAQLKVPVMAHPALAGGISSSPEYGISYKVTLGTLMRIAGADIVLFPSSYGTMALPQEEAFSIRDALTRPMDAVPAALPGPSAGIHPGLVPQIIRDYGRDVIVNAGGGVHGHPMGSQAGMAAIRQAIDMCLAGKGLAEMKATAPVELKEALALWSK